MVHVNNAADIWFPAKIKRNVLHPTVAPDKNSCQREIVSIANHIPQHLQIQDLASHPNAASLKGWTAMDHASLARNIPDNRIQRLVGQMNVMRIRLWKATEHARTVLLIGNHLWIKSIAYLITVQAYKSIIKMVHAKTVLDLLDQLTTRKDASLWRVTPTKGSIQAEHAQLVILIRDNSHQETGALLMPVASKKLFKKTAHARVAHLTPSLQLTEESA